MHCIYWLIYIESFMFQRFSNANINQDFLKVDSLLLTELFRYRLKVFVLPLDRFRQLLAVSKLMKITPTSIRKLYFIFRIHFFKIVNVWRLEYVEGWEYLGNTTQDQDLPQSNKKKSLSKRQSDCTFLLEHIICYSTLTDQYSISVACEFHGPSSQTFCSVHSGLCFLSFPPSSFVFNLRKKIQLFWY